MDNEPTENMKKGASEILNQLSIFSISVRIENLQFAM